MVKDLILGVLLGLVLGLPLALTAFSAPYIVEIRPKNPAQYPSSPTQPLKRDSFTLDDNRVWVRTTNGSVYR